MFSVAALVPFFDNNPLNRSATVWASNRAHRRLTMARMITPFLIKNKILPSDDHKGLRSVFAFISGKARPETQHGRVEAMRFEARELNPYAEPVEPGDLRKHEVYFAVQFVDATLLIPILEPLVFIGTNLNEGDTDLFYFQKSESYSIGVRYDSATEEDANDFHVRGPDDLKHIFEYEKALDVLLSCSLRRRR